MNSESSESEIKSWLENALVKEKLKNLSVDYLGSMAKGGGFIGDVLFVRVKGTTENGSQREMHLVLKCSKSSQALRENASTQILFRNEIYLYRDILPFFLDFQSKKGISSVFDSYPEYYGSFSNERMDVIVLENMKKAGYDLWNKQIPMTRKHIDLVMKEYGHFHAISAAIKYQDSKKFHELANALPPFFSKAATNKSGLVSTLENLAEEIYELFKNDLEEAFSSKWKSYKYKIKFIFTEMMHEDCYKVIIHGDCWNNNFMFYCANEDKNSPSRVAIIDWQVSQLLSPIIDLSYFIFSCISEDDIENLDVILRNYHWSFANHLREMGIDAEEIYPLNQLLEDWQKYSKFGIIMASLPLKMSALNDDELPDIAKEPKNAESLAKKFDIEIKNKIYFKNRISHIVNYVAKHELI